MPAAVRWSQPLSPCPCSPLDGNRCPPLGTYVCRSVEGVATYSCHANYGVVNAVAIVLTDVCVCRYQAIKLNYKCTDNVFNSLCRRRLQLLTM